MQALGCQSPDLEFSQVVKWFEYDLDSDPDDMFVATFDSNKHMCTDFYAKGSIAEIADRFHLEFGNGVEAGITKTPLGCLAVGCSAIYAADGKTIIGVVNVGKDGEIGAIYKSPKVSYLQLMWLGENNPNVLFDIMEIGQLLPMLDGQHIYDYVRMAVKCKAESEFAMSGNNTYAGKIGKKWRLSDWDTFVHSDGGFTEVTDGNDVFRILDDEVAAFNLLNMLNELEEYRKREQH